MLPLIFYIVHLNNIETQNLKMTIEQWIILLNIVLKHFLWWEARKSEVQTILKTVFPALFYPVQFQTQWPHAEISLFIAIYCLKYDIYYKFW